MESEDYVLASNSRFMQSLDGFHFQYINSAGNRDVIKIEINYSLRAHILESVSTKIMPRIFDDEIDSRFADFFAHQAALIAVTAAVAETIFATQIAILRRHQT